MADEPPLYDIEAALLEVAVNRTATDPLTAEAVKVASQLAEHFQRYFTTPAEQEIAGKAVLLVAASLTGLATTFDTHDIAPVVLMNISAYTGYDLVTEARRG